jgi:hypothetical protein
MNHPFKVGDIVYWNTGWNAGENIGEIKSFSPAITKENAVAKIYVLKGESTLGYKSVNTCYLKIVTKDWLNVMEGVWIKQATSLAAQLRSKIH